MSHELYSVSLLLCIAQNVRFEIPYKVLYFETPFLIIFKYYAWVSCGQTRARRNAQVNKRKKKCKIPGLLNSALRVRRLQTSIFPQGCRSTC